MSSKRRRIESNEKRWLKDAYFKETFTLKGFFQEFGYETKERGKEALQKQLGALTRLQRPNGIREWARSLLDSLEENLQSNSMNVFWQDVRQKKHANQMIENAQQEEAVYLRTRASTLARAIASIELSSHTSSNIDLILTRGSVKEDEEDGVAASLRSYILCFDEITPVGEDYVFNKGIKSYNSYALSLEDTLAISGITFEDVQKENAPMRELDTSSLLKLQKWLQACSTKKQYFEAAKDAQELALVSFLFRLNKNIIDEINGITLLHDHEEEFRAKHVLPLLQYVFGDGLVVRCGVPSPLYKNTNKAFFRTITVDFTIYWGDIELLCVEVSPFNANPRLVKDDEVRVGEMCKKMLHKRMKNARSKKEFCTFGATIAGTDMNLYKLSFDNGEYNYKRLNTITLPTTKATFAFMQLSLCALLGFRDEMMLSVPCEEDLEKPYLLDTMKDLKLTALYLMSSEV